MFETGTRVKRKSVETDIPAARNMRGVVMLGGRYNKLVCVLWDCDNAVGQTGGTWIAVTALELES